MTVTVEPLMLDLARPFRIAHGTSTSRENALVRLKDHVGEAALPPYYEYRLDDVRAYIESLDLSSISVAGGFAIDHVLQALPKGPPPAVAALDMALHDMWAKTVGMPLYQLLGLSDTKSVVSSYALSIPTKFDEWKETLDSVREYPSIKLKLGSGDLAFDETIVRIAREEYAGILSVDANSAWSIPDAVRIIPKLQKFDLAFIEQPIGFGDIDDWHLLRRLLRKPEVPLIADESVRTADDVIALAGAADGVNLKLAKCGGIRNVRRLITIARALDMKVMIGCMVESSLALTAAAHLSTLADFVDIDGTLHLANDPFSGLEFSLGRIRLPDRPGLGVIEK